MTGTFTLTGRLLDKSKQPVKRASLVLASNIRVARDGTTNELYAPPPWITTDDDGYLCISTTRQKPTPIGTPGVELIVGVQYRLRATPSTLIDPLVFTAPAAGTTLDIADIDPENPSPDTTWTTALADIDARLDDLESGGTGGGAGDMLAATYDPTAKHADAFDRANHTGSQTSATISDFTEAAQDAVAAALAGTTGATVTYDDAANTITITGIGDPETMRDTIGAALVGVGNISVVVNDAADTITISSVATQNSTDAALRDRSTHTGLQDYSTISGLATVAHTGAYGDLTGTPGAGLAVVIYAGSLGAARPTATVVIWQDFPTQPTNMVDGDLWLAPGGASLLVGTVDPTGTDGSDGDVYINRTAKTLFAVKASGSWPAGVSYDAAAVATTLAAHTSNTSNPHAVTKAQVGLGSVDNTADSAKPVSTAQATAISTAINNLINSAPGTLDTLGEIAAQLATDESGVAALTAAVTARLIAANNLSDLASAGTARTNLGLGTAATVDTGTTSGKIPLLSTGGVLPIARLATGTPDGTQFVRDDGTLATPAGGSSLTIKDEGGALATAATSIDFVGAGVTASGAGAGKTITIPGTPVAPAPRFTDPAGTVRATDDRAIATVASQTLNSGFLYVRAINLYAGDVLSAVNVKTIPGFSGGTHAWACLLNAAGPTILAVSADDTSATWAAAAVKTFTFGSAYTVTTSGLYYVGLMVAATTPSIMGFNLSTQQTNMAPFIAGTSTTTGLTTPPTVGTTMAAVTAGNTPIYAWLT